MYSIYLYSDDSYRRGIKQYGYWAGRTYYKNECTFPVVESDINARKTYKSLTRAINGGEIIEDKCGYVIGFDIEDDKGNVVYKSYKKKTKTQNNQFAWNEAIQILNEMENNADRILKKQHPKRKSVSEICLEIDDIIKKQDIPFETYKQIHSLLYEIACN
jgi:hypothetical protein